MVFTNFPSGVTSFGVPLVGGQLPTTQGTYWFVSSTTGSSGNPGNDISLPFAGLSSAISAASSGDVIVLLPNHAETITAAGGITVNKAGLTVIGMGEGATRPTFTFGTSTAATFLITSASFCMYNVVGVCNIDQLVTAFDVRAADVTLGIPGQPLEWHDGANNKEALRAILTTSAADRLAVNLVYLGFTNGTHVVNAVRLVGCDTGSIVVNFYGILTTAVVEFVTTACTNVEVSGYFYVSGTTNLSKNVVDTVTGSTWSVQGFDGAAGTTFTGGSAAPVSPGSSGSSFSQTPRLTTKVIANAATALTTGLSPVTLFTVTGDVTARVWATVQTAITSTGGTGTLSAGVTGNTAVFLPVTTADGTNFPTGAVWAGDTAPTVKAKVFSSTALNGAPIAGSANIICTIATNSMTAGAITFYCLWTPSSSGSSVA